MGRELRRKEERKNKNIKSIKRKEELDTSIKGSSLLKIAIFSVVILVVLYFVVAIFITKEIRITGLNDESAVTDNGEIENKILAKNVFKQREGSYYVYFYDFNDEDKMIASAIYGADRTVYRVDTSSGLNSNYVVEEGGNRNAKTLEELKVTNPTLIKVENDKITAYYEGSSEIIGFLN